MTPRLKVTIEAPVALFSATAAGPDRDRMVRILGEEALSAGINLLRHRDVEDDDA